MFLISSVGQTESPVEIRIRDDDFYPVFEILWEITRLVQVLASAIFLNTVKLSVLSKLIIFDRSIYVSSVTSHHHDSITNWKFKLTCGSLIVDAAINKFYRLGWVRKLIFNKANRMEGVETSPAISTTRLFFSD